MNVNNDNTAINVKFICELLMWQFMYINILGNEEKYVNCNYFRNNMYKLNINNIEIKNQIEL